MAMSGHKTASVSRYDTVNEADLKTAVEKQAAFLGKSKGLGTLEELPEKQEKAHHV